MRPVFACAAIGLWLISSPAAAATTAQSTLAALRAAPGCAPWAHAVAVKIRGRHAGGGFSGAYEQSLDVRHGRWATHAQYGPFAGADGFDGRTAWVRDFSGGSHALTAPAARAVARSRAWINTRGWCARDSGTSYQAASDVRDALPGTHVVLRATPSHGAPVTLFVDPVASLVDRTVLQLDENREVASYSDWRTVDGAAMAFQTTIADPEDDSSDTSTILTVQPARAFPPATFAQPAVPNGVSLPPNVRRVRVPYVLDGEKPLVNVTIDGKGPFPFVVDTGGHFILTAATARAVGVTPFGAASSVNGGSITKVGYARIRRLQIGGAVVRDEVAAINPYGFGKLERGPRPPKAGWLGLELLERFALTIDPPTRTMTLQPLAAPRADAPGIETPLVFTEDAPLVACSIAGKAGLCMIDTGNAGPTIVVGNWVKRSGLAAAFPRGIEFGGERIARTTIALGGMTRGAELVLYVPAGRRGSEASTMEAAILSEHLLDGFRATFDYARGAVWLQPLRTYRPAILTTSGVFAAKRRNGTLEVDAVLPGSPAAVAGLRSGDVIERFDGRSAREFSGADFAAANRAAAGTRHTYELLRAGRRLTVAVRFRELLPAARPSVPKR
jgi:hypothetical protein